MQRLAIGTWEMLGWGVFLLRKKGANSMKRILATYAILLTTLVHFGSALLVYTSG